MKRFSILMIAMSMLAALTFADARADGSSGKRFRGLWEGIDPTDGSSQKISISGGAKGVFSLLWSESYWTVCDGRRAVLRGVGERDPNERNTLVFQMKITCFDPEEFPVEDTITFRLVGQNMVLASAPGAFTDLPFYRVSHRVRGGGDD